MPRVFPLSWVRGTRIERSDHAAAISTPSVIAAVGIVFGIAVDPEIFFATDS
jgi:hypothetical protein